MQLFQEDIGKKKTKSWMGLDLQLAAKSNKVWGCSGQRFGERSSAEVVIQGPEWNSGLLEDELQSNVAATRCTLRLAG